jgi:hypothetical protein
MGELNMSEDTRLLKRYSTLIAKYHEDKLLEISKRRNIPISRLICIAIDNEMMREKPFDFNTDFPTEEYAEYTFVEEASIIIRFLQKMRGGMSIENLLLLRHDIGISDRHTFLAAIKEAMAKDFIEEFTQTKKNYNGKIKVQKALRAKGYK